MLTLSAIFFHFVNISVDILSPFALKMTTRKIQMTREGAK